MTDRVWVPVEPTEDQISAGMVAAQLESIDKPFMWSNAVRAAYAAMLTARPSPDDAVIERMVRSLDAAARELRLITTHTGSLEIAQLAEDGAEALAAYRGG